MQAAKKIEGQDRWATLSGGISEKRNGDLYFASNSPMFNKYHVSVLEARWKLVQIIDHKPDKTEVENFLFDMIVDPQEKNNLVKVKPDEIKRLAKKIRNWRSQHPINGLFPLFLPMNYKKTISIVTHRAYAVKFYNSGTVIKDG